MRASIPMLAAVLGLPHMLAAGGPCPERGMRVISVDGKPPNAAAVEPAPKAPAPRETT